ncbi:MAG: rhomboid family intramembrane serine protease [Deltaproteobacteria bacterium]|nr:rhomboid family intramembrane serine protease [Deltaproteobacteria bacterium]
MIPIGDENWDRQRWPIVTALFILANVVLFLYEVSLQELGPRALQAFIARWGVVPREYGTLQDLPPQIDLPFWSTLVTSMFLHGGWGHLLGNMLYLWVFGDNVEDRLGRGRFIMFYVLTGIFAALVQVAVNPASTIPTVGASGAISGVLGAYLVLFPRKRVKVLFVWVILEVPAVVVIGMWALTQFVSGLGTLSVNHAQETGGVAYMAHVGGFVAGVIGAVLLGGRPRKGQRRARPTWEPHWH